MARRFFQSAQKHPQFPTARAQRGGRASYALDQSAQPVERGAVEDGLDLLTVEEAAAVLQVHVQTVYAWTKRHVNPLPTRRFGRAVRIAKCELEAWGVRHRQGNPQVLPFAVGR